MINPLEARIDELDNNLESTSQEIFDTVCEEFNLDADCIAEELGCKCPFALVGFVSTLTKSEISQYSEE